MRPARRNAAAVTASKWSSSALSCHRPAAWPHHHCSRRSQLRIAAAPTPLSTTITDLVENLPIGAVMQDVLQVLRQHPCAVLQAPPGAGKTTTVPLAMLLDQPDYLQPQQKILVLEPRRVAAKVAARRMASLLGQAVGGTVGYRVRLDSKVGRATRVEVITEGLLIRRLQQDPELQGVGAVLLDEFHERNLDSDLALALLMEARTWARPDLRVLVMSATLGGGLAEDVAALMAGHSAADTDPAAAAAAAAGPGQVPVLVSEGRSYPVKTMYLGAPMPGRGELERAVSAAVQQALGHPGDILVFLPGVGEIRRVMGLLSQEPELRGVRVLPLHGNLSAEQQDRAIRPDPSGARRVILSTPIAESSLTINGVQVVVDSGYHRAPLYDPDTGISRLRTLFISQASADQRRGRAGRTGPGVCLRLWDASRQLQERSDPEIWGADLAPLALEVAAWGAPGGKGLSWLDEPDEEDMEAAQELLVELGATSLQGSITTAGRTMVGLGVHPRFAHLVLRSQDWGVPELGCLLANLLSERDLWRSAEGGDGKSGSSSSNPGADLAARVAVLAGTAATPAGWDDAGAERVIKGAQQMLRQLTKLTAAATASASAAEETDADSASTAEDEAAGEDEEEDVIPEEVSSSKPRNSTSTSISTSSSSSSSQPVNQQQPLKELQATWQQQAKKAGLIGALVALAYPDRIASLKHSGSGSSSSKAQFQLSTGATAKLLDSRDPLGDSEYIAIAGLSKGRDNDIIRLGAALSRTAIQRYLQQEIQERTVVFWAPGNGSVVGKQQQRLGALVLEEKPLTTLSEQQTWPIWKKVIQQNGFSWLPLPQGAAAWQQRAAWLITTQKAQGKANSTSSSSASSRGNSNGSSINNNGSGSTDSNSSSSSSLPDLTAEGLMGNLDQWLRPHLSGVRSRAQLSKLDWLAVFKGMMTWEQQQQVEEEAPSHVLLPTGTKAPISYSRAQPTAQVRMQEVFGLAGTPLLGGRAAVPLLLELLSPAGRPLQVTSDLAGFWKDQYTSVKKEMKGRYPRHYWPDDPLVADATKLTKKQMDRQAAATAAAGGSSSSNSSSSKRSGSAKKRR